MAERMASRVMGMCRTRTPMASNTALAMAAAVGPCEASPAPRDGVPAVAQISMSTAGTSAKVRMG